jgi:soluble lytic murein transglycosylase-like protein
MSKELYQKMARKTAEEFGLPVPMFMALVDHESGWKLDAKSHAGALGLGQVMPANLKRQGVNIDAYMKDPALQLNRSAYMYQDAIRQAKGDPILGLAYYNASPKAVNAFIAGKKGLPTETANYVPTVLMGAQKFGGQSLPSQAMADTTVKSRHNVFAVHPVCKARWSEP